MPNLVKIAASLPDGVWKRLKRPAKYQVKTRPRRRPENVKERIVVARKFDNVRLFSEMVAEFRYRPTACSRSYRVVVLCKNLTVSRGEDLLFDDIRYFFYISNDWETSAAGIVASANGRCNQENLNAQLGGGVRALRMPLDNLDSNWAYMVMAAQAWSFKAWFGLLVPEHGRWRQRRKAEKQAIVRMEFKTFLNAVMRVPCQIVRQGRRIVYRLLSWNRWQPLLFRVMEALSRPLRC